MNRLIREALAECGIMDLYESDEQRLEVIIQFIKSQKRQIECLRKGIETAVDAMTWKPDKW